MRVGIIGTGAISHKHARAYANIGYQVVAVHRLTCRKRARFCRALRLRICPSFEEVCRHPDIDYVDVCTFPEFRLEPVTACAEAGKHIQVQKPMATSLEIARAI